MCHLIISTNIRYWQHNPYTLLTPCQSIKLINKVSISHHLCKNNSNQGQGQGQSVALQRNSNWEKNFVHFTPIPITYTELLPNLISNGLVVVCPLKPLQPPYPQGYDANVRCDYHGRAVGHSTKRCLTFKRKVQSLLDVGWLSFQEDKPILENNPHSGDLQQVPK